MTKKIQARAAGYLGHDVGLLGAVEVSVRHAGHAGLGSILPGPHGRGPLRDLHTHRTEISSVVNPEKLIRIRIQLRLFKPYNQSKRIIKQLPSL